MVLTESIDSDIASLTFEAFETMLGSKVTLAESEKEIAEETQVVTSVVQITGNWTGAVTITTSWDGAQLVAERMFASDDLETDEICDAFGELANVIGGRFKSLLVPPVKTSLPSVTAGLACQTRITGGQSLSRVSFDWEGHVLRIEVAESQV